MDGSGKVGKSIGFIFAVAILLNYPWELAQLPLYEGMGSWRENLLHCTRCSLIDGVLVLGIFAAGSVATGEPMWFMRPGWRGYIAIIAAGLLTGVAVEVVGIQMGALVYSKAMPSLPALNVGLVPVLQMVVLPPIIFDLAGRACARGRSA